MGLTTQITSPDTIHDVLQHNLPLVDLRRHDDVDTQRRLVRLGTEPQRTMLGSHTSRTDHHLSGPGQHIGTIGHMALSRLGSQRHITERLDVVHIDRHTRILSRRTRHEPVHIQLGVTNLDRTDHTDHTALGHGRCHRTHRITTLIRSSRVRRHVVQTERVTRRTPRKRRIGEIRSDLLQRPPVLRPMGDHQVIAILGIPADRRSRISHDERPIGHIHLGHTRQRPDTINDALRERQVITRTRRHNRNPDRRRVRGHLGRGRGSSRRRGRSGRRSRG